MFLHSRVAKLPWVDLHSNVVRYYLLLFNIACVAGAWKLWAKKRTGAQGRYACFSTRVSPSCAPVLSCAWILSSTCYGGYGQYQLFNRDDDVNNNRQQSIVLLFFSFLLPISSCTKSFDKNFCKIKRCWAHWHCVDLCCLADRCYFWVCNHTWACQQALHLWLPKRPTSRELRMK